MRQWIRLVMIALILAGSSFGIEQARAGATASLQCSFDLSQRARLIAVTDTLAIIGGEWAGIVTAVDLDTCMKAWSIDVEGYPGGVIHEGEPTVYPPLSVVVGDVLYLTAEWGIRSTRIWRRPYIRSISLRGQCCGPMNSGTRWAS